MKTYNTIKYINIHTVPLRPSGFQKKFRILSLLIGISSFLGLFPHFLGNFQDVYQIIGFSWV